VSRALGVGILLAGIIVIVFYTLWLFMPGIFPELSIALPEINIWALVIPVYLAMLVVCAIVIWIGYTIATTPPPEPISEEELKKLEEELEKELMEEEKKAEEEAKEEKEETEKKEEKE